MTPFLADTIFWAAAAACAVAQIGILRATFRRADVSAAPATHVRRRATRVEELAWAVLPVLALTATLVLTWRALHPTTVSHVAPPAAGAAGAAA